jgi:hypothetical protein
MNKDSPLFLILRISILIVTQVFLFSKISLFGFITPMVYVIFFYVYPTHKNRSVLLTVSFLMGIILDVLLDSLAIHTVCLMSMAFLRPKIMRFIFGLNYELKSFRIQKTPKQQRYTFLLIVVFVHHFLYFSVEAFSISLIGLILEKVFLTSIATFVLSVLILSLFTTKKA